MRRPAWLRPSSTEDEGPERASWLHLQGSSVVLGGFFTLSRPAAQPRMEEGDLDVLVGCKTIIEG